MKTEEILNEREKTHGDFEDVSSVAGHLRLTLMDYENGKEYSRIKLSNSQKMALEMIGLKVARIVCGDPNHADHWDDIAGYAMLGKGKEEPKEEAGIICSKCNKPTKKDEYGQLSGVCWNCSWGIPKKEEGINSRCRVCDKEISKGTSICYWCAVNEGKESTSSKMEHVQEEEKPSIWIYPNIQRGCASIVCTQKLRRCSECEEEDEMCRLHLNFFHHNPMERCACCNCCGYFPCNRTEHSKQEIAKIGKH